MSWENHSVTPRPRGTVVYTAAESAVGAPVGPISQVVQGVQVIGGNLTISAGPVHHHEYHIAAEARTPALLKHVSNFRDIQIATLGKATTGTGVWILKWDTYILWLDPNGWLRIMWGFGLPGTGKTVMASIVIHALQNHAAQSPSPICVCYIYFRYSDDIKFTLRSFLEILVKQTIERHPQCLPLFYQVYAGHIRERSQPSEEELLGLLHQFTLRMGATFYVLDALDEAPVDVQYDIVQKLASLNVKLFITSQPMKTLQEDFPQAQCFQIVAQNSDLDLHISKEFARSPGLRRVFQRADPSWRARVISAIKDKCDGMFLHASLQLDALRQCTTIHDVQETLEEFPSGLDDVYLKLWNRVSSQHERKVLLVKRILLWVLHATRSLTIEELQQAVATSPETFSFDPNRVEEGQTLVGFCHGLVTFEEATKLVRLVHYTAQDTLRRLVMSAFPYHDSLLAAVCITRLKDCGFQRTMIASSEQLADALADDRLLGYAHNSWAAHARKSLNDPSSVARIAAFVNGCRAFPVLLNDGWTLELLDPLHLVAFYDLPLFLVSPESCQDPNRPSRRVGLTPLFLACLMGSQDCAVEGILNLPHLLVNARDPRHGLTALMWASDRGLDHIVSLLLVHNNIDVTLIDQRGLTALMRAAEHGRTRTVEQLLAHPQTDVNWVTGEGTSALQLAAQGGHEEVVQLLIAKDGIRVPRLALDGARVLGHPNVATLLEAFF